MLDITVSICCVVTILFIWFNTNFVFYYYELFTGRALDVPSELSYPEYLNIKSANSYGVRKFMLKLLSCYKCLSVWLSLFVTLDTRFFIVYIFTLFVYKALCLIM